MHFLEAIANRHSFFHELGSRLSDHGLEQCFGRGGTKDEATEVYNAARFGETQSLATHFRPIVAT